MAHEWKSLILSHGWVMNILATVRDAEIREAWVGAGLWRDLVWGTWYGSGFDHTAVRDVDVVFFDPCDLSRANDVRVTELLREREPDVPWEATNQAAVHTWYAEYFDETPPEPLTSIADAVRTWPETATSVAFRLSLDEDVEVCAPWGLDDLLNGVWRWNPTSVSRDRSLARLARYRPAERWPGTTIIRP
jgi:hypothetical protein